MKPITAPLLRRSPAGALPSLRLAGAAVGWIALTALSAPAWAQSKGNSDQNSTMPPSALNSSLLNAEQPGLPPVQPVQVIESEDKLTRIQELRVGGEIRRAQVQPKTGLPGYEVPGHDGTRQGPGSEKRPATTQFNLLRF